MLSNSQSFSNSYYYNNNHEESDDDSSTVFDADTVLSVDTDSDSDDDDDDEEVSSLEDHDPHQTQQPNNISNPHYSSQEEESHSPPTSISEFLRRINSTNRHRVITEPSTTTTAPAAAAATATEAREEISINHQESSSLSSPETSTTGELTRNEQRWKRKFQALCAYIEQHGHMNIPQSNKQFGQWISRQRSVYKSFNANKNKNKKDNKKNENYSIIVAERIKMLESINFVWECTNRKQSEWGQKFQELCTFKKLHGHTSVPTTFDEKLGKWVSKQRIQYRNLKAKKKSYITPERIEMLNSIGFDWVVLKSKDCRYQKIESEWKKRFAELLEYKEKYGDTIVSDKNNKDYKQLATWVRRQRYQYKMFQKNGKAYISTERIKMLNSIGFNWPSRSYVPRS